ncbi:hypothetical protein [Sedimentitalea arenosa]|uniref:DUF4071 domain-containing protein n=1 Tax=Sedimentitalea arenosa TaxID=2798803 RepID=A0A8J7IJS2_9RHOB|nr:hypothetical protein [Arenibacterium arenosum]MBJ6370908.1 hypothetical protein [Arenibacterium arenosum]
MSKAFFVTPIGSDESPERKRADNVMEHVLSPAIGDTFDILRADKIVKPGSITQDVIENVFESDLVIADLTGLNANVMYEVGIRHSFNRPIVQIAQTGEKLPFDIASERTVFFDITNLSSVASAKEQIRSAASAALSSADEYVGPIQRALNTSAVFRDAGDVGAAIEALAYQMQSLAENYYFPQSIVEGDRQIDHLYSLFSGLQPYEADRLLDKLRKL